MKKHTKIGFDAIDGALKKFPKANYLRMSAEIALSHHEKFDGTGYPNGLKEVEIPLSARIVALADIFDALISKRVYKEAYTPDVAKDIITSEKGKHLDPDLVDAYLLAEEKFIEISNQFKDGSD